MWAACSATATRIYPRSAAEYLRQVQARAQKDLKIRKNSAAHWGGTCFFRLMLSARYRTGRCRAGRCRPLPDGRPPSASCRPPAAPRTLRPLPASWAAVLLLPPATTRTYSPAARWCRYQSAAWASVVRTVSFVELCQLTAQGRRPVAQQLGHVLQVARRRWGASWNTMVRRSPVSSSSAARRSFFPEGRKPSKVNRRVSSPDTGQR